MKQFYPYYQNITSSILLTLFLISFAITSMAQDCSTLTATFKSYESRCAATGSIKVVASGGSGSYKYKATGPVNTNFTSTDSITGLQAGIYTVEVKDITTNCTFLQTNIVVSGNYQDIRFSPKANDITCEGASNGSITLLTKENGRAPFTWTIMAPSAMGVGTSNNTGNFNNLIAGDYSIRMTDSCGGIQTRVVTIHNYSWVINSYPFTKTNCTTVNGSIKVTDSKNNISTVGGIPGFQYGIVRAVGDTFWSSTASFTATIPSGLTTFDIVVKDGCGKVKKGATSVSFVPSVGASVNITNKNCSTFSAALTSISNFFTPSYSLYDNNNNLIATNSTGSFSSIPYGSYCIKALDGCTGAIISRCFTVAPPTLSIGNTVAISNKNCTTFTASITNQVGLTAPTYYLYDNSSVLISSNTTGVFNNLPYGSYSITTKDGCRDTTIQRFFSAKRWIPRIPPAYTPAYITCDKFGLALSGDSLTGPTYCIYDGMGTEIACNSTGVFDSLLLGTYTIKIHDACLDTTIIRTITVNTPTITNDMNITTANTGCNTYRVTVQSTNLKSPLYTLYNSSNVVIGSNSTGVFNNIPAGSYYVMGKNSCPDTTFRKDFSIQNPIPSVNSSVSIYDYTCSTFTAEIVDQKNLTSPQFCLYDNNNLLISCNTTGKFTTLAYGSYSIKITNTCYDTVITRNFSASTRVLDLDVWSSKSCTYGNTKFSIDIDYGNAPYNIKIYNSNGDLLYNTNNSSDNFSISNVPGIKSGETYKVVATDNCNKKDSVSLIPDVSSLTSSFNVISVCPGETWPNGSGRVEANIQTNMGSVSISIIKKNGSTLSPAVTPTTVSGTIYKFDNLEPATYIFSWKINDGCSVTFFDTVKVNPYIFPGLQNSSAYQCDVNGFTIGATASNGVAPFTYEIIGSFPASPSIIAAPQPSPLFNIDNGNSYSLVRLRALDACGNATLGDVSILPLADNKVYFSANCFMGPTTLTVDPLYNSDYTWYLKKNKYSTDSTIVSSGAPQYDVSTLLPSDTGFYVCKVSVAGGCITRTYNTRLDGSCYMVLSNESLKFSGRIENEMSQLMWTIAEQNNIYSYTIERKNARGEFESIGTVDASNKSKYDFTDMHPESGTNYYRLKLNFIDQKYSYSTIVALENNIIQNGISIFPNPVTDHFTVDFTGVPGNYKVVLMTLNNQVISQQTITKGIGSKIVMKRNKNLSSGLYLIRIIDTNNNKETTHKIIFK